MATAHIEILLSRNKKTIIDIDDYDFVREFRWYAKEDNRTWYAIARFGQRYEKQVFMHKMLTGYKITDHKNNDGLDNRRDNLREASNTESARNRRTPTNSKSKYKGVYPIVDANTTYWCAHIKIGKNKRLFLGVYKDEETAAMAYDGAAIEFHGEFAKFNFPDEI
jgi:hypothetical protein